MIGPREFGLQAGLAGQRAGQLIVQDTDLGLGHGAIQHRDDLSGLDPVAFAHFDTAHDPAFQVLHDLQIAVDLE